MKNIIIIYLVLLFSISVKSSFAQISQNTVNMGLGGGGTAHLTGYEALFVNPANLFFQEKEYSSHFSLFQSAIHFDTLLPVSDNGIRFRRYYESMDYFRQNSSLREISDIDKENIIETSFPGNRLTSEFATLSDIHWFGIKWVRPERSYAIALRTRAASRYEIGSGFFSPVPFESQGDTLVDQTLNYRYQNLHEISFGFAESFTFLNGLIPHHSEFFVGIAPKIVLSGSYIETEYMNNYRFNHNNDRWYQTQGFSQQTSGVLSDYPEQLFVDSSTESSPRHYVNDLFKPSGVGVGLDVGLTYVLTFGDEYFDLRQQRQGSGHLLRISMSLTDIGFIYYYKSPLTLQSGFINTDSAELAPTSNYSFEGQPNQQIAFLSQFDGFQNIAQTITSSSRNFETMLPMAFNFGTMYQYKRIKLMGDISYSIVNSAFNPSVFTSYFGIEVRPIRIIPIRFGTRLATQLQHYYSAGTGVETKWFDINASLLFRTDQGSLTSEIIGASMVSLKFYF